jgi:hypothetical protein
MEHEASVYEDAMRALSVGRGDYLILRWADSVSS